MIRIPPRSHASQAHRVDEPPDFGWRATMSYAAIAFGEAVVFVFVLVAFCAALVVAAAAMGTL